MRSSVIKKHSLIRHIWFSFLISLTLPALIQAQSLGANRGDVAGSGGGRSIQGRIFSPTGKLPEGGVRITLDSTSAGTRSAFADLDGAFTFNNLEAGPYRLTIDAGKEYEIARESVTIEGAAPVYQIPVYLRLNIANNPALAGVPKSAVDLYIKGIDAARKGDNKKAVEQLEAAVTQYPQFSLALSDLGGQYMRLGQMDKAAASYETLLKITPRDPVAHTDLGIALYNLSSSLLSENKSAEASDKLGQSEKHLREALKLNSKGPTAHYYLGLTLIRLKKYGEAQKEMELTIANGGENLALAHKYLGGLYLSAKRNKEAADELEKYLQLDPKARDGEQIRTTIKDLRSKQ